MSHKKRDEAPGAKIHRITATLAGQSATLSLPSTMRSFVVHPRTAGCRLFFSAADEAANVKYFELTVGGIVSLEMAASTMIFQALGAATISVITTHDALRPTDAIGEDYTAA